MDCIKEVLDEAGIIYQSINLSKEEKRRDASVDAYLINLSISTMIVTGGIIEGDMDNHVTILFFGDIRPFKEKYGILKTYEIINRFNQSCRYGNFVYDDGDITYSLSIPIIERKELSKSVFKYYFDRCLSTVKDAFGELQNES